jgi:predicted nucleic acid binding AN1-type Zn finger protein
MLCNMVECSRKINFVEQTTNMCNKCHHCYCKTHRLAEFHSCSYNYKIKTNKEIELFVTNNKCVNDKLVRI